MQHGSYLNIASLLTADQMFAKDAIAEDCRLLVIAGG